MTVANSNLRETLQINTYFLGGANLPKFSWWEFCCSTPNRVMSHRKTVIGRNQDARSKRSSRAFEACAVFLAQKLTIIERKLPRKPSTCEKGKGKQKLLMLYLLSHIQFLNAIGEKNDLYDLMLLGFHEFQLLEQPGFVSRNLTPRWVVP